MNIYTPGYGLRPHPGAPITGRPTHEYLYSLDRAAFLFGSANHWRRGGAHAPGAHQSLRKSVGPAAQCAFCTGVFGSFGTDWETGNPDCPRESQAPEIWPYFPDCRLESRMGLYRSARLTSLFQSSRDCLLLSTSGGDLLAGAGAGRGSPEVSNRVEAGPGGRLGLREGGGPWRGGRGAPGVPSGLAIDLGSPSFLT